MIKIITVIGARPQFVKAAALSREFKKHAEINEIIVHTGQHFDKNMSGLFFEEMEIPRPDYNLNINSLNHGAMTGQMLEGIEKIILSEKPDYVLVYGDTNSTLSGALAAKKLHVKVIHVEAGLRSYNMKMPEEVNRILTDRLSDILFCPTETAIENLRKEGFDNFDSKVVQVGDVMEDASFFYAAQSELKSIILKKFNLKEEGYILATLHRAENTDNEKNLIEIISALNNIHKRAIVIVPMHPRTSKILEALNLKPEFIITEPLGYFDMLSLLRHCKMVITDSGGLQKEAYFFSKFCITMRDQTEWIELVQHGYNFLTGPSFSRISEVFSNLLELEYPTKLNLYGNGMATQSICKYLLKIGK